jgi:hypothetical protein
MNRREILKYTAMMTGVAVSGPLLSSILSGCSTQKESLSDFQSQFFSKEDFQVVQRLVDTILPKTDSPAASEVGVDQTIDTIIARVYSKEDKEAYAKRFSSFSNYLNEEGFMEANEEEKLSILKRADQSEQVDVRRAYLDFKQQTISYYLSSEEIGEKFLNYLPVPGAYEPCIPLESVGNKIWSI